MKNLKKKRKKLWKNFKKYLKNNKKLRALKNLDSIIQDIEIFLIIAQKD